MGRIDCINPPLDDFNHFIYSYRKPDLEESILTKAGRTGKSDRSDMKGGNDMEKEGSYLLEFTGAE